VYRDVLIAQEFSVGKVFLVPERCVIIGQSVLNVLETRVDWTDWKKHTSVCTSSVSSYSLDADEDVWRPCALRLGLSSLLK